MKSYGLNVLISALMLVLCELTFAQQLPKPFQRRFFTRAEKILQLEQKKPINHPSTGNAESKIPRSGRAAGEKTISAISYSEIGQLVNPYSAFGTGMNCLSAVPALNTVAFIRRGGPQDPGGQTGVPGNKLFFDISTTGGNGNWAISRGPIFNDDAYINRPNYDASGQTGSTYGSRYPQGGIWNPPGNNDTANALVLGIPRVLDGSNGALGGLGTGWKRLSASAAFAQNLETSTNIPHYRTESMEMNGNAILLQHLLKTSRKAIFCSPIKLLFINLNTMLPQTS